MLFEKSLFRLSRKREKNFGWSALEPYEKDSGEHETIKKKLIKIVSSTKRFHDSSKQCKFAGKIKNESIETQHPISRSMNIIWSSVEKNKTTFVQERWRDFETSFCVIVENRNNSVYFTTCENKVMEPWKYCIWNVINSFTSIKNCAAKHTILRSFYVQSFNVEY